MTRYEKQMNERLINSMEMLTEQINTHQRRPLIRMSKQTTLTLFLIVEFLFKVFVVYKML